MHKLGDIALTFHNPFVDAARAVERCDKYFEPPLKLTHNCAARYAELVTCAASNCELHKVPSRCDLALTRARAACDGELPLAR